MNNVFLGYWSNEGFESIQDITKHRYADVVAALSDTAASNELNQMISSMQMRARFNPQRAYECYAIEASEGIELQDLQAMAKESPQALVNLFREKGVKIFGDPKPAKPDAIT
jgi:hypothetical protein